MYDIYITKENIMNDLSKLNSNKQYYYRNCPQCDDVMIYDYPLTAKRAENIKSLCQSCAISNLWAKRRALKAANKQKKGSNS